MALKQAKLNYEKELQNEEIFFREKSRELWLKFGDHNTIQSLPPRKSASKTDEETIASI